MEASVQLEKKLVVIKTLLPEKKQCVFNLSDILNRLRPGVHQSDSRYVQWLEESCIAVASAAAERLPVAPPPFQWRGMGDCGGKKTAQPPCERPHKLTWGRL